MPQICSFPEASVLYMYIPVKEACWSLFWTTDAAVYIVISNSSGWSQLLIVTLCGNEPPTQANTERFVLNSRNNN